MPYPVNRLDRDLLGQINIQSASRSGSESVPGRRNNLAGGRAVGASMGSAEKKLSVRTNRARRYLKRDQEIAERFEGILRCCMYRDRQPVRLLW
jgi:hypothetical protein